TGEPDRTAAGDIGDHAGSDARGDGAMVAGGEDIGKQGQVANLRHRLVFVRELQQVEIGVWNHDVFGLPADPSAHVDVAVGGARPRGIHVQADAGLAFLAVAAAAAGDVEGHRTQVADFDELDIATGLDDFAGDLVAED